MPVGLTYTKADLDNAAGHLAQTFQRSFEDVYTLKAFCDRTPDADLVALGYTTEEVTVLKTAINDLMKLADIWTGSEALPAPYDFRTFVQQLWGLGAL